MWLVGAVAVLLAAGAGWFAAAKLISSPVVVREAPPLTVRAGAAELTLRSGWRSEATVPKLPGLDGAGARAFAPADGSSGRMVVTLLAGGASGTLPKATVGALRVPLGRAKRIKLGGLRGVGYTALALRGVSGLADLYAVRTANGILAVGCIAPIDDPLPVGSCPGDIQSVAVARPVVVDPAAKLKAALPAVMTTLNAERATGRAALRSGATNAEQAAAARGLWRAYAAAAATLAPTAPRSGAAAQLPAAFRDAARAYRALGAAASGHHRPAWRRARQAVDAAEKVAAARLNAVRR